MQLKRNKKNKSKRLVNKRHSIKKRGGTKKIYSNVSRRTSNNTGNNLRQSLVNLCKQNDMESYDKVTQHIMREYWEANRDNNSSRSIDFFTHLKNNYDTFSINTKLCLERCLTQLQEDAIPESMYYLSDIIQLKQSLK
jgi:hypothetical protein